MSDLSDVNAAHKHRKRLLKDPYRPRYHYAFLDCDGRPGDPNGCFYADGFHHLMYLYKYEDGSFRWGHISSHDLLHWQHKPDSLIKGEFDEGCFSGGAFVDEDGTAYLSYWIFSNSKSVSSNYGIGIASSRSPYDKWVCNQVPIIRSNRWGICDFTNADGKTIHLGCADPSNIWKKDGVYFILLGNLCVLNEYGRTSESDDMYRGDWVELYSSVDLGSWSFEGRFYQRRKDNSWTDETEDNMCPSYLPLPSNFEGGPPSGKMLQLFISHNKGCQYYLGRQEGLEFLPEVHGRMSWNDNAFFAPEAYIDSKGRHITFSWLRDNLDNDFQTYGWSGVYSLPRTLWLDEGFLGIAPVSELRSLRCNERDLTDKVIAALNSQMDLNKKSFLPLCLANPFCCEIEISLFGLGDYSCGIELVSDSESAQIFYDSASKSLVMDITKSRKSVYSICEKAPLTLNVDESLVLDIFIDRSVLEVFAQNRQAICRRVYFTHPNLLEVNFTYNGNLKIRSLKAWEISPTNPY